MASKKKKNKGGGKRKGKINLRVVFDDDIGMDDDEDEDALTSQVERSLKGVREGLELFGMTGDDLEYYASDGEWTPLTSEVVSNWGDGTLLVRDASDADEKDNYVDYPGDNYNYDSDADVGADPSASERAMILAIAELAAACRGAGLARSAAGKLRDAGGKALVTEEWVVARAAEDPALLRLIVNNVGALDHIVRCIHLDPVWEGKLQDDNAAGGEFR